MAVNHADGCTWSGAIVCPVCASGLLFYGGTGWLSMPCVVVSLPVCLVVLYVSRVLTYLLADVGLRLTQPAKSVWRIVAFVPFFLLYMVLPPLGVLVAFQATIVIARQCAALAVQTGGWSGDVIISLVALVAALVSAVFWQRCLWVLPLRWMGR